MYYIIELISGCRIYLLKPQKDPEDAVVAIREHRDIIKKYNFRFNEPERVGL